MINKSKFEVNQVLDREFGTSELPPGVGCSTPVTAWSRSVCASSSVQYVYSRVPGPLPLLDTEDEKERRRI